TMRHRKAGRTLSRTASHRLALMRNLTSALIRAKDGRIITTVEKAKEARPFVEKLITLARQGTLQARRLAKARLGPCAHAPARAETDRPKAKRRPSKAQLSRNGEKAPR